MSERASDAPGAQPATVPAMGVKETFVRYRKLAPTLAVALLAAVISYNHIYDLGLRYGGSALTASLLPLVVDGTIAAVSAAMLAEARAGKGNHPLYWATLITGIGATVAANVGFGLRYGIRGAVLWGIPPVLFVLAAEVTMLRLKREAVAPRTHPDAPASKVRLSLAPEAVPSVRAIMREERVGRPRAQQIRAELLAATG